MFKALGKINIFPTKHDLAGNIRNIVSKSHAPFFSSVDAGRFECILNIHAALIKPSFHYQRIRRCKHNTEVLCQVKANATQAQAQAEEKETFLILVFMLASRPFSRWNSLNYACVCVCVASENQALMIYWPVKLT